MSTKAYIDTATAAIVQPLLDERDRRIAELEQELALNTGIADGLNVALIQQEIENTRLKAELREAVGNLLNDNSPQNREDVYALLEVKE